MRPPAPKPHICINIILRSVGNVAPQSTKSVGGFAAIGMQPSWIHIKQIYPVLMVCRDQNTLLGSFCHLVAAKDNLLPHQRTFPAPSALPVMLRQMDTNNQLWAAPAQLPQITYMSLEILTKFYHFRRRHSLCWVINPPLCRMWG